MANSKIGNDMSPKSTNGTPEFQVERENPDQPGQSSAEPILLQPTQPTDDNTTDSPASDDAKDESNEWIKAGEVDALADADERSHIYSVLQSFRQYRQKTHYATHVRRQHFYALPTAHVELLSSPSFNYLDTLCAIDDAVDVNADLAEAIYESACASLGISPDSIPNTPIDPLDHTKARQTLHQLFRDWSSAGSIERATAFQPIHTFLTTHLPLSAPDHCPRILVPGAGLGRLVLDLAGRGYEVQGNELSYHQLFASSFMLNHCKERDAWRLHPFCADFGNVVSRENQMREVKLPDVVPEDVLRGKGKGERLGGSMSMTAGDFCECYGSNNGEESKGEWDAVVTLFFVDTAPDFVKYVETVLGCLRVGGVWVNAGPLLWHWDGSEPVEKEKVGSEDGRRTGTTGPQEKLGGWGRVELSHEEVLAVVKHFGFEIVEELTPSNDCKVGYCSDEKSMLQHVYRPAAWVAKKVG